LGVVPIPPKRPLASEPITTASVVGANSIFALAAVEQGDTAMPEEVEAVLAEQAGAAQEAPAPLPVSVSGWKIQLAAVPTEASALEILDQARAKAPGVLANASPYTEIVVKEDVTLYRARFAGFGGKAEAREACAQLTKRKFACLALSN
jgi:D-alanyl-D-alanine carboxypeptidase